VFSLDLETCEGCRSWVRVIASIEDPVVIAKILAHVDRRQTGLPGEVLRPGVRGPPPGGLDFG